MEKKLIRQPYVIDVRNNGDEDIIVPLFVTSFAHENIEISTPVKGITYDNICYALTNIETDIDLIVFELIDGLDKDFHGKLSGSVFTLLENGTEITIPVIPVLSPKYSNRCRILEGNIMMYKTTVFDLNIPDNTWCRISLYPAMRKQ